MTTTPTARSTSASTTSAEPAQAATVPEQVPPQDAEPTTAARESTGDGPATLSGDATDSSTAAPPTPESMAGVVAGWLALVVVGVWVALANEDGRRLLLGNWPWLAVSAAVVLAIGVGLLVRWKASRSGVAFRATVVVGLGLPLFGLLLLAVTTLPLANQLLALRSVFLVLVIFTPTVMWWLFVAAQRQSLLNEFIANLDRLGLLEETQAGERLESSEARRTRVSAYLQKFEASFVRVPKDVYDAVVAGQVRPYTREESAPPVPLATSAVPVLLTLALLAVGWLLTLPPTDLADDLGSRRLLDALVPEQSPVNMAFLGAYFFSLQMLFRRYVRRDLRGSAYVAVVLRVILAVVGTWAVTEVVRSAGGDVDGPEMLTVGFVIGVFPKVAWQIVQSTFAKMFRPVLPSLESQLPLSELDGLTVWHEARFEEEDIENVPNMATADLVELLVSTRYSPDRVIDWVDQAILLTQLGSEEGRSRPRPRPRSGLSGFRRAQRPGATVRAKLAVHGIRNASCLMQAIRDAERRQERQQFDRLFTDGAGSSVIPSLLASIRTNCNFGRVLQWRGIEP